MKCPTKPLVFCAEQVLLRSSPPNEVFLDDVQVPAGSLLGEENDGWSRLMQSLNIERLLIASALARAPELGKHTNSILAELGYDKAEIEKLRRAGVV